MEAAVAAVQENQESNQTDGNKFQKAITTWRNIGLTELIKSLDSTTQKVVSYQRDSLNQRKDLAQKTKDFRKLDDNAKIGEVKTILKAYQTYIDDITEESKKIYSAFLKIYSPLADAPDPCPLLETSIESFLTAEDTLPKLTKENEQLHQQVQKLNAQLEATESDLDKERSTRKELESSRQDQIKAVESSWTAALLENKDNWDAKEKALDERIENQDRLIKEIKANYEVSQRLSKGESNVSQAASTTSELQMLHSELEHASARLADVQARNEQISLDLAQATSQTNIGRLPIDEDPEFLSLLSKNEALLRNVDNLRIEKASDKRNGETQLRTLERKVSTLIADRDLLKQKVAQWSDYESVKQELDVYKAIESATGDEDESIMRDTNADSNKQKIEQMLVSRNKRLTEELTLLRVSNQDMKAQLESVKEQLSTANQEWERSRSLVADLEEDLEKVQQEATNNFPSSARSVAGTYSSRYLTSSYKSVRGGRSVSPTSSIISGYNPSDLPVTQASPGASSTYLPLVIAQRDRLKNSLENLKEELGKAHEIIQSLRTEVAALQKDNLQLYEKTRYASSYNRPGQSRNSNSAMIDMENFSDPSLHRYRSKYEDTSSPFSVFKTKETARAYRRLGLTERVVFEAARRILATRLSRNLFAAYCAALHFMVVYILFSIGGGPRVSPTVTQRSSFGG